MNDLEFLLSIQAADRRRMLRDLGKYPKMERKYLPTFADLCDRLAIVLLKRIFISENRAAYQKEIDLIQHDMDEIITHGDHRLGAAEIYALLALMLTNREIWLNESKARQGGSEQDKLLRFSHSLNGQRNRAKNILAIAMGERIDLKVDCFAAELAKDFGAWDIFANV